MLSIYLVADSLFCYREKKWKKKTVCTAPSHRQLFFFFFFFFLFWEGRKRVRPIADCRGYCSCGPPAAAHGRHCHSSLWWEEDGSKGRSFGASDAVNDVVWCRSRAATRARNRDAELSTHLRFWEFSSSPHFKH